MTRIKTTHTGSLPRGAELHEWLRGPAGARDEEGFARAGADAVAAAVRDQDGVGIDVINDGEQMKPSYTAYVCDRLDERRCAHRTRVLVVPAPERGNRRVDHA